MASTTRRYVGAAAVMTAALAFTTPAQAAPQFIVFPEGVACPGFDLGINITPNANRVTKTFTDSNGNVVRIISAGKGDTLTFRNERTGTTLSLKSNGSVSQETFNPDGSSRVSSTGHNVIILFPTDVPAGPTTTLFVGRVTYTSTATDDFVITSTSGQSRDICAELR